MSVCYTGGNQPQAFADVNFMRNRPGEVNCGIYARKAANPGPLTVPVNEWFGYCGANSGNSDTLMSPSTYTLDTSICAGEDD